MRSVIYTKDCFGKDDHYYLLEHLGCKGHLAPSVPHIVLILSSFPQVQPSPSNGQKSFFTVNVVFISNIIRPNFPSLPPEYKPLKLSVECCRSAMVNQLKSIL